MSHAHPYLALAIALSLLVGGATPVSGFAPASTAPGVAYSAGTETIGEDSHSTSPHALAAADRAPQQTDDASASFPGGNVTVTRGDEVTFSVSHSDPANVTIGGPEYGFHLTVALGGSGTSEVTLDTRQTTAADPAVFVEGGSATLHSAPLDEPIEPEDYLLRVSIDGVERDIGTLTVDPRGETTAESYRAPGAFEPSEYVDGGEDGDANVGPLETTMSAGTDLARGDYAVVRFEESGLESALNTSDLTGAAAANGLKVNFTQTTPGPNQEPREYVATASANVSVLPSLANDEIYVLWDTSEVPIGNLEKRNRYRAALTLTDESGLADSPTTIASTPFHLSSQSVSLSPDNDSVHYPWENSSFAVSGTTNRAPNTTLEVRLRSPDPNAFLQLRDATVGPDGDFEASFDLSSVSRGTNATLWVRNHFLQTAQDVYLVAPDPSVRIEDQTANGTALRIASAEVPAGGFVRLEDADGSSVGRSDYLAPGEHTNVTAELGTPLFEAQQIRAELVRAGEEQSYDPDAAAYTANDAVVNDTARIEFPPAPTETSTPTRTATATATSTATPYPVVTRTPLAPAGASQSSLPLSPGVAVAALLGAGALLARRGGSS